MLTVSKFTTGVIYDRIGLRGTFSICCGSGILAFFLLGVIENTAVGVVLSMVYALLVAFALPLETVMIPLYAKDMFGDKSYDRLMGLFYSFNTLGYAVGGPLVNLGFDMFGTYKQALLCVSGILVVVLVGFQFIETAAHNVRRQVTGSSLPDTLVK